METFMGQTADDAGVPKNLNLKMIVTSRIEIPFRIGDGLLVLCLPGEHVDAQERPDMKPVFLMFHSAVSLIEILPWTQPATA